MTINYRRVLTAGIKGGQCVSELIEWKKVSVSVGTTDMPEVEIPASWSQNAANILARNYLRKAGIPNKTVFRAGHGDYFTPSDPAPDAEFGCETSARQIFHRLAGHWTYAGLCHGYFGVGDVREQSTRSQIFYDEVYTALALQMAAPNSPQFFNTGLNWAYGIVGPASGQWYTNSAGIQIEADDSYSHPQTSACFLSRVEDDLVNEHGIMDLWVKEARIFKHGSGSGVNVSNLRSKYEGLSGGGIASGVMSWLDIGDRAAGAIKSGGTTRRAALLRLLDDDHPEIEEFIDWKMIEEAKAASMEVGSKYIKETPNAGIQIRPAMLDRIAAGFPTDVFDCDWEGSALQTVSGQNSNNSIRVSNSFMDKVISGKGGDWGLRARTTGDVIKSIQVDELWNKICRAAWACADPGLMFGGKVNAWNTCATDGEIRTANPCLEFLHLDGSACNLASINLIKFRNEDGTFDYEKFSYVCHLFTIILDISVSMSAFPGKEYAVAANNYRTIGLGYTNLGALLMCAGLPYDSDKGRATAACITAIMTGSAYRTSSELATSLGAFPRWEANRLDMLKVIHNHAKFVHHSLSVYEFSGDSFVGDVRGKPESDFNGLVDENMAGFARDVWKDVCIAKSFRNAQTTLLAPTGTISLIMDADTFSVEPDLMLRKHKVLSGGGSIIIINESVEPALRALGYHKDGVRFISDYIKEHNTVEGCYLLDPDHWSIFDCSNAPAGFTRSIHYTGHIRMVAAVVPFLSGSVSKTINMPREATIEDVSEAYKLAYKLQLKAVALYRDKSKLTQPLNSISVEKSENVVSLPMKTTNRSLTRGVREEPPSRRKGITQKARIAGQSLYWRTGEYPDGRLAEVFIDIAGAGSALDGFANCLAKITSIAIQYGAPQEAVLDALLGVKFEPSGVVELHDDVKMAHSIPDLIARDLKINYLGAGHLSHVVHAQAIDDATKIVALDKMAIEIAQGKLSGYLCWMPNCGGLLRPTGNCFTCDKCGEHGGCA